MTTNDVQAGRTAAESVMIAGFVFLALLVWVGVQVFLYGAFDPTAVAIGVVAIVGAGLVTSGRRWGLSTATVLAAVMLLFDLPMFLGRLGSPDELGWFLVSLLGLCTYVAILAAGVRALGLGPRSRQGGPCSEYRRPRCGMM